MSLCQIRRSPSLPSILKYLREMGFYSYDAADEGDDPVKRWIGREVKRFLHEADIHLPYLLRLAAGRIDRDKDDEGTGGLDLDDDDFEPTAEEVAAEAGLPSLLEDNARRWDEFLEWVRGIELPWVEDSDDYRKYRALLYCNGARAVARGLLELKPTMESWVPHIACNVVPRQIVLLGNPSKRSADACESFGAVTKKIIKHLTCRRALSATYRRGYIEQAFRRVVVRCDLLHGPENTPYLLRRDHVLLGTGRLNKMDDRIEGPAHSIRVKVEQESALS